MPMTSVTSQGSFWVFSQPIRCYIVTGSLIGWAHTQNDHCPHRVTTYQYNVVSICQDIGLPISAMLSWYLMLQAYLSALGCHRMSSLPPDRISAGAAGPGEARTSWLHVKSRDNSQGQGAPWRSDLCANFLPRSQRQELISMPTSFINPQQVRL